MIAFVFGVSAASIVYAKQLAAVAVAVVVVVAVVVLVTPNLTPAPTWRR